MAEKLHAEFGPEQLHGMWETKKEIGRGRESIIWFIWDY